LPTESRHHSAGGQNRVSARLKRVDKAGDFAHPTDYVSRSAIAQEKGEAVTREETMKTRAGLCHLFALCLGALALLGIGGAAAQDYPTRPVHFIVCFAAGGPNDITARLFGQYLSEHFGQQFIIENRPGAGGNVGMASALASPPDGYTIVFVGPNNFINPSIYDKLPFDFIRDSAPVAGTMQLTNVLEVNPSVPAKTLTEFIAYAKANPGKINYGSGGVGTSPHMSGELLKKMTGIDIVHVPYRGSAPAVVDLLGGQLQAAFDNLPGSIGHIKTGKLRALGVTAAKRVASLPEVPAISETVPGYEATVVYGIAVPKGTPPGIVDKLNAAVNTVLKDPKLQARIAELGAEPMPMSPAGFGKLVADETAKWAEVVKSAGIKAQ
jgi:tripartite-type tricarboxylate transporter receptor subunit TctC